MVSPWGIGVVNTVAEIDGRATSWHRTDVTQIQMRSNGLKELIKGGAKREKLRVQHFYVHDSNREKCSKSFDRSWAYFLARFG
jgi:hypothetical protein